MLAWQQPTITPKPPTFSTIFLSLQYTLSYLVSLSEPLCFALDQAFCSLAWLALMFPLGVEGGIDITPLCFLCYKTGGGFFFCICCIFRTVEKPLPHFNNNNNDRILYHPKDILLLSLRCRSKFMVSHRDSGSAGRMCANTGAWTQVIQSKSTLLSHYTSILAFFFSKVRPILDLQHWVIVSGHNPMACLWPASCVKQVFWKFEMDGERERSVARCQGP